MTNFKKSSRDCGNPRNNLLGLAACRDRIGFAMKAMVRFDDVALQWRQDTYEYLRSISAFLRDMIRSTLGQGPFVELHLIQGALPWDNNVSLVFMTLKAASLHYSESDGFRVVQN